MTPSAPVFLEDLSVGDEFRSGEYQLDEDQIVAFAREFDPQPFHTDGEAAQQTFFQGLAASGWHTAAITMKLLVQSVPLGGGLIGAGGSLEWPRPTRPGDTLRAHCRVLEIKPSRSKPDRGIVTTETLTLNQHGETCQRLVTQMVVMCRPA